MPSITISDGLIILATILGPILAVQAQKAVERVTQYRRRQEWIFETLMATRATRLAPVHVRALNQIDLDFAGSRSLFTRTHRHTPHEKAVIMSWRNYADILNEQYDDEDDAGLKAWAQRADDRFVDLLAAMAEALHQSIDRSQIKRGVYYPRGFSRDEQRSGFIQDALASVLAGRSPLRMRVDSLPGPSEEAASRQAKLEERLAKALGDDGMLRVVMRRPKD
jgi:hypothetical protein